MATGRKTGFMFNAGFEKTELHSINNQFLIPVKKIKWGILGCGDVAEVKSGPAFQKIPNSELVAVMRRDGAKAKDFALRHQVPNWYDNADDLLKDNNIDAVYIATPPSSHLQYALKALNAGKHVYLEKPMVLNTEEAVKICEAVKKSKNKLTVAHYRRRLPAFLRVKELLDSGAIGDVRFADIQVLQAAGTNMIARSDTNWRVDPSISGGGYFYDIAPHQIDLMCHYFGEYSSSSGYSKNQQKNYSANDIVNGLISFKNGVQFRGIWCFNVSENEKKDNCSIYGSKGMISFSFYGERAILSSKGNSKLYLFKNPTHVQQPMIAATTNYFLGNSENPCSAFEGLIVAQIMELFCK